MRINHHSSRVSAAEASVSEEAAARQATADAKESKKKQMSQNRFYLRRAALVVPRGPHVEFPYILGCVSEFLGITESVLACRHAPSKVNVAKAFQRGVEEAKDTQAEHIIAELHAARARDQVTFDACLVDKYGQLKADDIIQQVCNWRQIVKKRHEIEEKLSRMPIFDDSDRQNASKVVTNNHQFTISTQKVLL